jgi:hypothetical protein
MKHKRTNPLHIHKCQLTHHRGGKTSGYCKCECGHRWRQSHRELPKSPAPTRMKKWEWPR